ILAEVYAADRSHLDRQIDLAFAATRVFDRDAARFRLVHCEAGRHPGPHQPHIRTLCDKVEFLSASTAENASLPLFLGITETAVPKRAFGFGPATGAEDAMSHAEMVAEVERFDPADFLVFAAQDDATRAAMAGLATVPDLAVVAAEYQVIATSYEDLIAQVGELKEEWDYLQANAPILTFQVIALCLVAFAAPFRLGRSVVALN
ncbi:MAG: hypothetical protein KDE08_15755, partial [Rhodobacteraceae bacterium]|nr:hypothetical protein [Paracoccaceae bacterium]